MTESGIRDEGVLTKPKAARKTRAPVVREARASAATDDRHLDEREAVDRDLSEDRDLTDDERLEIFQDSLQQSVLPDLPKIPGHHVFWASTTHQRDTITWRLRLGYRPIKQEDMPGWAGGFADKAGLSGVICINEMVAMKIPLRLYNKYMREVHHNMPRAEEEKLRATVMSAKEQLERVGSGIVEEGDGTASLAKRARPMPELTS